MLWLLFLVIPIAFYLAALVVTFSMPQIRWAGWISLAAGVGALVGFTNVLYFISIMPLLIWTVIIVYLSKRGRA